VSEVVIIRQNADFETEIMAVEADNEASRFQLVERLNNVTPDGLFLSSLGCCTAVVLHTYAQNHGLQLQEVEIRLEYRRLFREDCQNCEDARPYEEQISEEIALRGNLTEQEREKLFRISHQCPIHKMLQSGIEIRSQLALTADTAVHESVSRK
jgi:putative redox protein